MSAVVQWLRLKATSPAPPAGCSASSSSKRSRRFQTGRQEPAQQAQQNAQQPQHAAQQLQQAQEPQQAQHAAQNAHQAGSAAGSILNPAVMAGNLHPELPAPSIAASSAAKLLAAPLDTASCIGTVTAQQEHAYMDTLAQLRSNMFEDMAVLIPDELPAAGRTPGIK